MGPTYPDASGVFSICYWTGDYVFFIDDDVVPVILYDYVAAIEKTPDASG